MGMLKTLSRVMLDIRDLNLTPVKYLLLLISVLYVKNPWIGPASQGFVVKISSSVTSCSYSVKVRTLLTTTYNFLSSQKDVLPILQQSMVVEKFECLCDAEYIGRTV